jgi:hypothetical protein
MTQWFLATGPTLNERCLRAYSNRLHTVVYFAIAMRQCSPSGSVISTACRRVHSPFNLAGAGRHSGI